MQHIYLLKYNNYTQRIHRRAGDTLSAYSSYIYASYASTGYNFVENNGIDSVLVLNIATDDPSAYCDYILVADDTSEAIISRWFIINQDRLRNGQFRYTLRRDLLSDYSDMVKRSEVLFARGPLPYTYDGTNYTYDPVMFNPETFAYSKVKKNQVRLKKDRFMWLVIYLNKNAEGNAMTGSYNPSSSTTWNYSFTKTVYQTKNVPYDVLFLPVNPYDQNATITYGYNGTNPRSLTFAQVYALLADIASRQSYIYDIQLLPYPPVACASPTRSGNDYNWDYSDITSAGLVETIVVDSLNLYLPLASTCFRSEILTTLYNGDAISDYFQLGATIKESNDLYQFRLCSGDRSSIYEIKPACNISLAADPALADARTRIASLQIAVFAKSYTPFIYIQPTYDANSIFGRSGVLDDFRGLVVTGDFSMGFYTSEWNTYVYNNKNYQKAFDRQIDKMYWERDWKMVQNLGGIGTSTVSGAGKGAQVGGAWGAVAGAVMGFAGSAIKTGIEYGYDEYYNIEYAKDMFNWNNENIQSRPTTLNKVEGWNSVTYGEPVLEIYGPADADLEDYRNKIGAMSCNLGGKAFRFDDIVGTKADDGDDTKSSYLPVANKYRAYDGCVFIQGAFKSFYQDDDCNMSAAMMEAISRELQVGIYWDETC